MSKSPGQNTYNKNVKHEGTKLTNFSDRVLLLPARNLKVLVAHVLITQAIGGNIIAQFSASTATVTALDPEHILQTSP